MYIYVCIFICIYMYIYMYIYTYNSKKYTINAVFNLEKRS